MQMLYSSGQESQGKCKRLIKSLNMSLDDIWSLAILALFLHSVAVKEVGIL